MLFDPNTGAEYQPQDTSGARQVQVPFLSEEIGLGALIKRLTSAVGVQPCGGCQERARRLDERVRFVPWGE
jgi:hypothetical protein